MPKMRKGVGSFFLLKLSSSDRCGTGLQLPCRDELCLARPALAEWSLVSRGLPGYRASSASPHTPNRKKWPLYGQTDFNSVPLEKDLFSQKEAVMPAVASAHPAGWRAGK